MTEKVLAPVHPNIGLELEYTRLLNKMLEQMHKSVMWWIMSAYKANLPHTVTMALDESSAVKLEKIIRKLTRYWNKHFYIAAKKLAKYFAEKSTQHANNSLENILKASGFAIQFKLTPAENDVLRATIQANVALITKMSQQHLKEIEGMVMRSVQQGRNVGDLAKELESAFAMSKKRSRLIARDQNNKATAAIVKVRQNELNIKQAKWLHSHAGKKPRPTHVAMNGKLYDVDKGMWDENAHGKGKGDWVWPGELINCRCVSRSVINVLNIGK